MIKIIIAPTHKTNGGLSDARNAGLDRATGAYIMFVDSDDYLDARAVEILMDTAQKTGCRIAYMRSYLVDGEGNLATNAENTFETSTYSHQEYVRGICEKRLSDSVCDKLFRADLLADRRFEKGRLNEDFLFLSKMLFEPHDIAAVDYAGYYYFQRTGSISRSGFSQSIVDAVKNCYELVELSKTSAPELTKHFARLLLFQARVAFITMPFDYVKSNADIYTNTYHYLRKARKYIGKANLKATDKALLYAILAAPKTTLRILSVLWRLKRKKHKK